MIQNGASFPFEITPNKIWQTNKRRVSSRKDTVARMTAQLQKCSFSVSLVLLKTAGVPVKIVSLLSFLMIPRGIVQFIKKKVEA